MVSIISVAVWMKLVEIWKAESDTTHPIKIKRCSSSHGTEKSETRRGTVKKPQGR
jgi:hypothetical protein